MRKYMVMDLANFSNQYWGHDGELVHSQSTARKFTIEQLIMHKGLSSALNSKTVKLVEVNLV